jgi:hypothetical protein
MPLGDLQTALGMLVTAPASAARSGVLDGLTLAFEERAWLDQLTGSPGLAITCRVQRWWRETRLRWTVRLTMTALGTAQSTEVIEAYLDASRCASLFFIPEAVGFLDWVVRERHETPHLRAVARFERALILAAEPAAPHAWQKPDAADSPATGDRRLRPHPAAAIVEFSAPPELVIGALLSGDPPPPPNGPAWPVLVAPGLPNLWRPATWDEVRLFARLQPPARAGDLLAEDVGFERPLYDLLSLGALCSDG